MGWSDRLVERIFLMRQIQASEAKTHLPQLLDEVERGETVIITRHGRPIARLVPEADRRRAEIDEVMAAIEARRRHAARSSVKEILAARDEGRKP
jgi:prevent-host-death family protein